MRETSDPDQIKYYLARDIYRKGCIDRLLPSCQANTRLKRRTWRDWWLNRFGDNYDDYIRSLKNDKST